MGELDDLQDPVEEEQPEIAEQPESEVETDTTVEETPEQEPEVTEPEKEESKDPIPYQKFSKVWGERQQYRKDAEYWREQALKSQPAKDPEKFSKPEPKFDDFDDIGEYNKAITTWELDRRDFERGQEEKKYHAEMVQKSFQENISKGTEKYPDFNEIAFLPDGAQSTEAIVQILSESDRAADIVYYFGKNKQEAARIAELPPVLAAREIGRLELKMSESPKKVTTQPTPTSPISGKEPPPMKNEDEMSMEEWEAAWDKGKLPGSPAPK